MSSLADATRALELYQDQMLENDNLSYLAIIQLKDRDGNPIDSYTIEAAVESLEKEKENRREMGMIESKRSIECGIGNDRICLFLSFQFYVPLSPKAF